jgi:4-coumarate--CoA ligase
VKRYGLQEGDTVALFSQNTIWYPVAMHATLRVGGKVSGASPAYNAEEMAFALTTSGARFLMTHPDSLRVAVWAAREAKIPRENIFLLEGEVETFTTVKDLIEMGREEKEQVPYYTIPEGKTNFDICE